MCADATAPLCPVAQGIAGRALITLPGTLLLLSVVAGRAITIHDISTDTRDHGVYRGRATAEARARNTLEIDARGHQRCNSRPTRTCRPFSVKCPSTRHSTAPCEWPGHGLGHLPPGSQRGCYRGGGYHRHHDIQGRRGHTGAQQCPGTLLDLRSVSRVGIGDIGANAKRIRAFQQKFEQ